jgi:hypothetical protein
MAVTRERFDSGMTYEQWLDSMTQNKDRFLKNYDDAKISPDDVAAFKKLRKPLNVLVLAEDWCGDVVANLPILAKLVHEAAGKLNLRIFKRDANLDLADQHLYKGEFRSIPLFLFLDSDMQELGCWWERPQIARDEMDQARSRFSGEHPDLRDASKPPQQMSEATRKLYTATFAQLRAENAARWTDAVVDELRAVVKV